MKEKWLLLLICFLSALGNPSFGSSGKYSFEDLEVLNKQKNYWEFLQHAKDIKPGQRNKHWKEMVHNMAVGLLQFNLNLSSFSPKDETLIEKISHWPILKEDEFFQVKHNQYQIRSTRHCLMKSLSTNCLSKTHQFWKFSRQDPETGYQLAKIIKGLRPSSEIWIFLAPIATHAMGNFYCSRPLVANQLKKQLLTHFRPFIIPGKTNSHLGHQQIKQKLDSLFHPQCWKSFLPKLKEKWLTQTPRHQIVIHKILEASQNLKQEEQDLFYTLYLLRTPLVGETFNRAWNHLIKLGQDFSRRSLLLKKLAKRDPLEGKVFSSPHPRLSKNIIRHFSQNFPEYLKLYAQTCLEYLQGKKIFPHGNPTLECRELLQASKQTPWINQSLRLQFSGLKRW